jgi:uncharacterized repeat protein (TIGR01451 family)
VKYLGWLVLAVIFGPLAGVVTSAPNPRSAQTAVVRYLSPSTGAKYVPPGTTVALRLDGLINPASLSASALTALGSASGSHTGQAFLADDGATVVYKLDSPFTPGEHVEVTISRGLATTGGAVFAGLQTQFSIGASGAPAGGPNDRLLADEIPATANAANSANAPAAANAVSVNPQNFVTFPHDFPAYTITVPATNTAPGLLFMAPVKASGAARNFLFIVDDSGQPVYWQPAGLSGFDFKLQPDGSLTYYDTSDDVFHVLDTTYSQTKTIAAVGGLADLHDLQIITDTGHWHSLLLIYNSQTVDMTQFGGYPTATVTGLTIQELDSSGLPVFQWDSFAHIPISDTQVSLTTPAIDYMHGNAIELDNDGNLLLSSRHLSEITKINRTGNGGNIGDIIWRLGGKANQFTINDAGGPFVFQHDIRRLANGDLTIFDNHNPAGPSRAVEYQIDEVNKVVTNTWQYRNTPDISAIATGNNQHLPDGQRLIDWGFGHPNVTEVMTDGTKLFEMDLAPGYISYRAFRFPWAAVPTWDPLLVLTGTTPTLYYSWNGATDVASWEVYGGFGSQPQSLVGTQPRTGFEDHTVLVSGPPNFCAFRVRPIDHAGQPQRFSNVVYTRTPCNGFADVAVTTSVNVALAQPGQALTYTLVYTNAGPDLAPTVSLTDIEPANLVALTYTSSGAALTPFGPSPYTWQVADLAPGAGGVVTVTGMLSSGPHGSVFTNTAAIGMVYSDTNPLNNTSGVSVTMANVAPVSVNDGYTFVGNSPFTAAQPGVLANDSDANNDDLTAVLSAGPLTGTLSLNANGSFTYTAPALFSGPITFTYRASDGLLFSAPALVTITINAHQLFIPMELR